MIKYRIGSRHPQAHYFDLSIEVPEPDPEGQVFSLPTWIPGSYMIRDFAKNIVDLQARCNGEKLEITQLDKSRWQAKACQGALILEYRVYAWDLSVRGAHLDTTHGFFNGTSVFMSFAGFEELPCELQIERPEHEDCADWRLATTMLRKDDQQQLGDFSFGPFKAPNYQELIDHPVEMGLFVQDHFEASGVRHDLILTGRFNCDLERLKQDLIRICEYQITLFGTPAPMPQYMFLTMVVGDGYGGLEHRNSTSLMCSRKQLPVPGMAGLNDDYRGFLGLCSHEYFHSWNVKRIRPEVLLSPDLSSETYTPLLWAFEGITSYYDDLCLLRSGCIDIDDYLDLLGQTMTRVQRGLGRHRQSAAESSFNAWTKFYKQDENAANAIVSYYAKGALIALAIDLRIRDVTNNRKSLDDVMRMLWQRYQQDGGGVDDQTIQQCVSKVAGADLEEELNQWIYQPGDIPLQQLLEPFGISIHYRSRSNLQDKGGKQAEEQLPVSLGAVVREEHSRLKIVSVEEGGSAQSANLSAGDEMVAINGLRASQSMLDALIKISMPGDIWRLSVFRRDELMEFQLKLLSAKADTVFLTVEDPDQAMLKQWINS